jgi:uncharacterized protein YjbI with pentapeptide repeats
MVVIGIAMEFGRDSQTELVITGKRQPAKESKNQAIAQFAGSIQPLNNNMSDLPAFVVKESVLAKPTTASSGKLPGVFRGDWGEIPIYTQNDRVNFERAAYVSLENDNQNQTPSASPAFWRLVKQFKVLHEDVCFSPKQGADLAECDFTEATSLKDINLKGAKLSNARLSGELGSADLSNANLSGVTVIGSLVISPDTKLDHANLSKLQSDGNNPLIAESANLNNTNLSEANLYGAKMNGANLVGAKLTGATLTGAELSSTHLEGAELSKTDLTYANLTGGVLANAALSEANLSESNLADADFTRANLQQANLAGSELSGVDFSGTNLQGTNLTAAKNTDRAIIDSHTDFTSAICPDGVSVDGTQVITCVGHGF